MQWDIKKQIKLSIKNGVPENELVVFKFPNDKKVQRKLGVRWIEGHEFKYKGNMYDVVKTLKKGNEIIYYCINDHQEKSLFSNLNQYVNDVLNFDITKSKILQIIKKLTINYFMQLPEFSISVKCVKIVLSTIFQCIYDSVSKEVLTPPPQF